MVKISPDCLVHRRKSFGQFKEIINKIRQKEKVSISVLQKLEKECCTCNQPEKEISFDNNYLEELYNQLKSSDELKLTSKKSISNDYLTLRFPLTFTQNERNQRISRLIGRQGKYIQNLETKFNLQINIINTKSGKHLHELVNQLKIPNCHRFDQNILWILINSKNNENNQIKELKEVLINLWKSLNLSDQLKKNDLDESKDHLPFDEGDTRWKPKKFKSKNRQK